MRVHNEVKNILASNPKARESDKELIRDYLRRKGLFLTPEQENILFAVSLESLTRARRKIQEGGEYLPNEGVQQMRRRKAKLIQKTVKHTPPDEIINANPQQLFDDRFYKDLF